MAFVILLMPGIALADYGYAGSMVAYFHANPFYIFIGLALIVAEFILPTKGLLGLLGIAIFVLGTFSMAGHIDPMLNLSWTQITLINIIVISGVIGLAYLTYKGYTARNPRITESLAGKEATVIEWNGSSGRVEIGGSIWLAEAETPLLLAKDDKVIINAHENLTLFITPLPLGE